MAVREKFVKVINGTGGPNDNAIPVYSENKAPLGDHVIVDGHQLMLPNGFELVCVDPQYLLSDAERHLFYNDRGYAKVWAYDPVTKHGIAVVPGYDAWVEASHLGAWEPEPPQPEPEPEEPPVDVDYEAVGIAVAVIVRFIKNIFSE